MESIITKLTDLGTSATPLEFITETGITTEEGKEIISKIKQILTKNDSILALGAPQIGVNKRIFCIKFKDSIKTFINPIILKKNKESFTAEIESFASMPNKEILISRPNDITIVYYNDDFKYEDNKLLGMAARLFDQQYQLLDGITPADYGMVFDLEQDGSLREAPEEILNLVKEKYLAGNKKRIEALQQDINTDKELADQYNKLNFTEKVISGEIAVVGSDKETEVNKKAKQLADTSMLISAKADKLTKQAIQKAQLASMLTKRKRGKK